MKNNLFNKYSPLKVITVTSRSAQERGREFEQIINDLFDEEGILLSNSYYTSDNKSEQIDGAIEVYNRIILLEIKWVETNLAASDLYSFIGKVENKLDGTLGLFISYEELSKNFIESISKGRNKKILIIHGEKNIDKLFDDSFSIKNYIEYIIKIMSFDNVSDISTLKYEEYIKDSKQIEKDTSEIIAKSNIRNNFLKYILTNKRRENYEIIEQIEVLSHDDLQWVIEYLINKYPQYYNTYSDIFSKNHSILTNIDNAIIEILNIDTIIDKTYKHYFKTIIKSISIELIRNIFWDKYSSKFEILKNQDSEFLKQFCYSIQAMMEKYRGNFYHENLLTEIIEPLWSNIPIDVKESLYHIYLDFLISSRYYGHEQKDFAKKLVISDYEPLKKKFVKKWIIKEIKKEIKDFDLSIEDLESASKYFAKNTIILMQALDLSTEEWILFIQNEFKKLL